MPDAIEIITRQAWLKRAADTLADVIKRAYGAAGDRGLRVKGALNGVWLGHPLHAALTDVPLGAWTTALALDAAEMMTGREEFSRGARAVITIGVVGAAAAAVAGVTDWSDIDGRARRVGLVHGTLNLAATGLFVASLVQRRTRERGRGRACALLGYIMALGAACLGGDLVYSERIGVDHTAGQEVPEEFTSVLAAGELEEGRLKKAIVGGTPVLLVREGNAVRAMAETCSHLGGPLAEGTLKDGTVICPWLGSCFALADGRVVNGPATHAQPCFEARVRDGQIEIRMPRRPEPAAIGGRLKARC